MRRYPLAPLVEASGLGEHDLARRVGLSGSTLKKARLEGLVESAADRYAIRAGFHPYTIWPEMLDHVLEDVGGRQCAADGCDNPVEPPARAPHKLYCSRKCAKRERMRRYRATPAGAAANRRHRNAYYEENRGYELALKKREREERARRRNAA